MKHTNQIKECKCGYYFGGGVCQCKVHTSHFTCIPVSINEEIRTPLSTDNLPCGCPKKDEYSRCIQQSHLADKEGNCIDAPHGSRSTNCPVHCRRATDKPPENAVKLHPCASNTIVNQLSSKEDVIVKSDTPKSKSGKDIDVPTKSEEWELHLQLYLTSAGDRRRTIYFIRELLKQKLQGYEILVNTILDTKNKELREAREYTDDVKRIVQQSVAKDILGMIGEDENVMKHHEDLPLSSLTRAVSVANFNRNNLRTQLRAKIKEKYQIEK